MLPSTVILAAVRGELKPLVRSWAALKTEDDVEGWQHPSRSVFALCGGMGAGAATRAFARARAICIPTEVVSVGWVGALLEETEPGAIFQPSHVLDTRTGEMFGESDTRATVLLTTSRVAAREEKYRLKERYPYAAIVDMEAATIARLCVAHGIPFRAIKAVSDTLEENLPDLNPYIDARGRFHTLRFAASAAIQPKFWPVLSKFGKQAAEAAENLAAAVRQDLGI